MSFRHRLLAILLCLAAFPLRGAEVSWFRQKPEDGLQATARGVIWRPAGKSRELHTHFAATLPAAPGSRVTVSLALAFDPPPPAHAPLDQIRIGIFTVPSPSPRDGDRPETTGEGFMVRLNPYAPSTREATEMRFRGKSDAASDTYLNGSSQWKAPKFPQAGFDLRDKGPLPVILELERRPDGSALARFLCGHGMIESPLPGPAVNPNTLALSVTGDFKWTSLAVDNLTVRVTDAAK